MIIIKIKQNENKMPSSSSSILAVVQRLGLDLNAIWMGSTSKLSSHCETVMRKGEGWDRRFTEGWPKKIKIMG